ncbi:MAG: Ig-like domain-containing protein [Lachnospiraceae bacterium]|nr:Ig-like domain-containing protein [Lachnospiraceae bacterium]
MKKNIFDTEIEMIDLDSVGNMEVSYDDKLEPNSKLGNDVEMVMKETQVISSEEIEAIMESNTEISEEIDAGETKVIDTESIEEEISDNINDNNISETVAQSDNEVYAGSEEYSAERDTEQDEAQEADENASENEETSEKLKNDESYDFENDVPKKKVKKKAPQNASGKPRKKKRSAIGAIEIAGIFLGVILLVLLGILGTKVLSNKARSNSVQQFAAVGNLLSDIDGIGNEGIEAIGEKAQIDSITVQPDDTDGEVTDQDDDTENDDEDTADPISVNFSSIEKDLKIKFIDKKTGKLVTGVKFEVSAKGPKGDKFNWVDSDTDGIIYVDKLQPGNYEVRVLNVDKYVFPDLATIVKVQDTVVYQVINVIDEAVDMDDVDLSQEDDQDNDVDEGPKLEDTVPFVEPSAVQDYIKIAKSDIQDPRTIGTQNADGGFRRVYGEIADDPYTTDPDTPAPPSDVFISKITIGGSNNIAVGEETGLSIAIEPDNATSKDVTWSSSDPNVASVDGTGKVRGLKAGTTTIVATAVDANHVQSNGHVITVENRTVLVEAITLENASVTLGGETTMRAVVTPENATNKTLAWSSDKPDIVSVDGNGTVKGLKAGTAIITAKSTDGSEKSASATVTVTETNILIESITLQGGEVAIGGKTTLKATITPENASNKTLTWSSSDTTIATVNGNGEVTGLKEGTVKITAKTTDGSEKSASADVVVKPGALKLTVLGKDGKEVGNELVLLVNESYQLTAKVEGAVSDTGVKFATSQNNVATVSDNGLIKALVLGATDITVTTNEKDASGNPVVKNIKVTVKDDLANDNVTPLKYKDKDGKEHQVFIKNSEGKYVEAKYADYYRDGLEYFIEGEILYTGWQTINGNVYYYTAEHKKVTGEQVIQGVKYSFASDGALIKGNGTKGIDVSAYQGDINWTAVKNSGVSFVIIRCGFRGYTQGGLILDKKYKTYVQGATAAGLKVGLYIFSQAINEAEAVEEASLCVNLAQGYKISYPIFLDSEYANSSHSGRADGLDKQTRTAVCKAFCETIKSAGYVPGVYASKSWFYNKLDAGQLNPYKIWLAHYCGQTDYTGKYDLWQHSSKGSVNGIKGNVDLDISYLGY